ncbi:hypothetical protein EON64_21075, partial [archaeon]
MKLKLYTAWSEGARAISLHSLRLRYFISSTPLRNDNLLSAPYLDMLQLCSMKMIVGMQAVRLTADMVSMNKTLLGMTAIFRSAAGWRVAFPFNSQAVELLFEFAGAEGLFKMLAERLGPDATIMPQNLKLLVWNAAEQEGASAVDQRVGTCSAVKDVDVVLNQSINVYSGVVPQPSSEVTVSKCLDRVVEADAATSYRESPPHIIVSLYPDSSVRKDEPAMRAARAVPVSSYNDTDELEGTSLVRLGTSGGSSSSIAASKPDWLREESTNM